MLVATLGRSEPIYEALTTRAARAARQNAAEARAARREAEPPASPEPPD